MEKKFLFPLGNKLEISKSDLKFVGGLNHGQAYGKIENRKDQKKKAVKTYDIEQGNYPLVLGPTSPWAH